MARRHKLTVEELEPAVQEITDDEAEQVAGGLLTPAPIAGASSLLPLDRHGDVKNLDGAPGGSDSTWIDLGAPATQRVEWPPP